MIASAAAVAAAEGLGCLAVGLGCFLQSGQASGRAGWLLCCRLGLLGCRLGRPQVGLEGSLLQIGGAWLQIGLSSRKAGGLLLSAISAGLIHENQPTVCKGTAFSWNKYQKQGENIIFQSFCDLGR